MQRQNTMRLIFVVGLLVLATPGCPHRNITPAMPASRELPSRADIISVEYQQIGCPGQIMLDDVSPLSDVILKQ